MEPNQNQTILPQPTPSMPPKPTQDEMLLAIYENTKKTKNYMKWSLYITVVLVVLPLLAALFIVPFVISSLSSSYGSLLQ